nr:MFS transporter [Aestuariicella hydrocarbonica]
MYVFRMMGLFMVLPVLALYGEDYAGSTPFLLGLALGAYGLTQAVLQIPFGMLSDRWGRKPVIALGLIIFAVGSAIAASADSVYGLILGRALQGGGAIASAIMAMVADLTSDESRTKAMATIGASIGVSFSVALVAGPILAGLGGLALMFWVTVGLAVIGLWILFQWVPTPVATARHRDAGTVPKLLGATIRNKELLRLNWGIFTLHFVLMASFLVMPAILESQLDISRNQHWMVYLPLLVLAFVAMVPFIIIAEKKRKMKWVFVAAVVLLGAMMGVMALEQHQRVGFMVGLFFFFMAFNLLEATLPSLMSKLAPAGAKGTASGVYATCQFLGAFCGGTAGGWLLQSQGVTAVFGLCVVMIGLWVLVASTMRSPRYLKGLQVPLAAEQFSRANEKLSSLPGVVEVVLIRDEAVAYLKVDPEFFRRDSLAGIEW